MFVLNSNITIGDYSFNRVHAVKVKRSIHTLGSTASIKIPATAYFVQEGEPKTAVETAKQFKAGDKVEINLAYNEDYQTEFVGFVKRINYAFPVEVECEDYIYWLKKKDIKTSWPKTSLKEVLQFIIADTHDDIKLSGQIPNVEFTEFEINSNAADALQKIKDHYGLTIYFETDGTLYAGLSYVPNKGIIKYQINGDKCNIIKGNQLKYRLADDIRLKVKAVHIKADNTKIEAELGDEDGEQRTLFFYDVENMADLEKLAQQEIDKLKFDGYDGKITTFLQPYAEPGYIADLSDSIYADRSGEYYIESTEVNFNTGGARRIVEIGIKVLDNE
jgi:hypothetical protein